MFTRFAPSPTGYLHRGHILSALFVFAAADIYNCKVRLRIEDHDQSRAREAYVKSIPEDLARFGFTFDSYSIQSARQNIYQKYFDMLSTKGLTYRCNCSRKKLFEENPVNSEGEVIYQGLCLANPPSENEPAAIRFKTPNETIAWNDLLLGEFNENPHEQCGDMVLKDRIGQWTYQFAVVCDDFEEDISLVVRGEDIRNSTARQIALSRALGRENPPQYLHHPLLYASTGQKLSKREHDVSVRAELESNSPEKLLAAICTEVGLTTATELTLQQAIDIVKPTIAKHKFLILNS